MASANPFNPALWEPVEGFEFTDITYHRARHVPAVRVAINRPEVRNAFRPKTVDELYQALDHARMSSDIGCVLLTGNGPSAVSYTHLDVYKRQGLGASRSWTPSSRSAGGRSLVRWRWR